MEFWTGLYLMSFLNMACCLPKSSYTVHFNKLSFENAQKKCLPGGFLTDILNKKEMEKILKTIWDKNDKTATSFWIGLKKNKGVCVKKSLPLKGFYWTANNSTHSEVNVWKTNPSDTCTEARCGLLSVEYSHSGATSSGFVDATCRQEHTFICKRNVAMVCPRPNILGIHDIIYSNDPYTCKVVCSSGASFNLTCSKDLVWTVDGNENISDISQICLECKEGYRRDASGNCACSDKNEDVCDGLEPSTTDDYSNDNRGKSLLNQPTSLPDDVSTNETGVHIEEKAGDISNIIVPVIIALLIFIVLLVIIAAIVKGCLRRRSAKLAPRKTATVALNGSSVMEKANEKEET
ncbi:C-type lectin domain family 14 member A [Pseudorasbora parva]|uniref:C-type lectin domain family 14 member A n=1 Tax=Pseudorasbora parva TaxID=51549 RepID=UPI00351DF8B6